MIWRTCQRQQFVLGTANRNQDRADALEAVIRAENTLSGLPALTLGDPAGVFHSPVYPERVAAKLIGCLIDID